MSKKKTFRPKPRLPRGFADDRVEQIRARDNMISAIREVYELYGFEPLETPAIELTECLGKFLPDTDRPEGGVFSFQDDDEAWLSLRYDLTAPLARFVAENYDPLPKPFRRYQVGPVWRNEKPGPGRFRQFYQFDVDSVGTASVAADAELAMVLSDALERLGIRRDAYKIRINNRKILDGVLTKIGVLGGEDTPERVEKRLTVLRAIDKLDRLGPEGVRLLLGRGRKDESGDFTEGAQLSDEQTDIVLGFVGAGDDDWGRVLSNLTEFAGTEGRGGEGIAELTQMGDLLSTAGYGPDRISFDPSIVRGLGYYTGPVLEAELLDEITYPNGERVQIGSVAGGGRYDDLVARFKGQIVPATGVSIGISRLAAALSALKQQQGEIETGPVIVLVMDQAEVAASQAMVAELRQSGIRSEMYLGTAGMKAQLKYADKRAATIAVIEGEDERAKGELTLKDLALGAELSRDIADNKTWREDQPAQVTISKANLVEAVCEMLTRQKSRGAN